MIVIVCNQIYVDLLKSPLKGIPLNAHENEANTQILRLTGSYAGSKDWPRHSEMAQVRGGANNHFRIFVGPRRVEFQNSRIPNSRFLEFWKYGIPKL